MMYLGIDLSKAYFDVTLQNAQGEKHSNHFDNDSAGFKALQQWLKAQGVKELHVCMEATNVYWEKVAQFLYDKGYQVSVVGGLLGAARIKGFAMSQLRRNKTDKQDSDVIVDFCRAIQPKRWTPPSAEVSQLRAMVRLRATLVKTVTQQQNRLGDCQDAESRACYQRLIDTLKGEITQVEGRIEAHLAHHPHLQEQADLIDSIQGLGPISAWTILAEMPDIADYENAHAAAADAGVNPSHHESGDTIRRRPKLSKVGKASIRGVLHMPAITAIRHNPVVKALAERLANRGKPKNLIIAAAMRKLIHLVYGVLKNKRPFDPNYAASSLPAT
jgi:transposase